MSKATEKQLAALHGQVARTLSAALDQANGAELLLEKYQDELPEEVIQYLQKVTVVHPSVLTVATKFLKDNDITTDVDFDDNVADLRARLNSKTSVAGIKYDA